jgi:hypothetical protein
MEMTDIAAAWLLGLFLLPPLMTGVYYLLFAGQARDLFGREPSVLQSLITRVVGVVIAVVCLVVAVSYFSTLGS